MACCEYVKLKDDIDWGRMEIECILDLPQTPGRQGTETVQSSLQYSNSTVQSSLTECLPRFLFYPSNLAHVTVHYVSVMSLPVMRLS